MKQTFASRTLMARTFAVGTLAGVDAQTGAPTVPGIEQSVPNNRLHFSVPVQRLHVRVPDNRLHMQAPDEDQ